MMCIQLHKDKMYQLLRCFRRYHFRQLLCYVQVPLLVASQGVHEQQPCQFVGLVHERVGVEPGQVDEQSLACERLLPPEVLDQLPYQHVPHLVLQRVHMVSAFVTWIHHLLAEGVQPPGLGFQRLDGNE